MTVLRSAAFGAAVGLEVEDEDESAIRPLLPWWWVDAEVAAQQVWPVSVPRAAAVIGELELWVAEHAVGYVFVHAAVVAVGGRALVLPGRSHSGKTTLASALLRAGADYLSDEYAVFTPDGLVLPYPRPLSPRAADGTRPRISPEDLGARAVDRALQVGAVALLTFGGATTIGPVTPAAAVLGLLDNTVAARSAGEQALSTLGSVVDGALCLGGGRGEADEVAPDLLRRMSVA